MQTPLTPSNLPCLGLAQLLPLTLSSIIQRHRLSAEFLSFFLFFWYFFPNTCTFRRVWNISNVVFIHKNTITLTASYIQHIRTNSKQVWYQFMELKISYCVYLTAPPRNCHMQGIITADFGVCPAFPCVKGFNQRTAFVRDGKVDDHSGSSCYSSLKGRKLIFSSGENADFFPPSPTILIH